jgi:hypothetical protein
MKKTHWQFARERPKIIYGLGSKASEKNDMRFIGIFHVCHST